MSVDASIDGLFESLVCSSYEHEAKCQCGKWHRGYSMICPEDGDTIDSEIPEGEEVKQRAEDYLLTGWFDGQLFVKGCECRKIDEYQKFFIRNEELLRTFYKESGERRLMEARRLADIQ